MIRRMQKTDLPEVAILSKQLGYPVLLADLEERFLVLDRLADLASSQWMQVAIKDGKVAGFIHASKFFDLIESTNVRIVALVVDENARGGGIGASLMSAAEAWASSIGVKEVWLTSDVKRDRAHAFYQRLGYPIKKTSHKFIKSVE